MNVNDIKKWMLLFQAEIKANKDYLCELDTPIGDGDHGTNMNRGMDAVMENFNTKNPNTVADAFKLIGMTLVSKVGGASGPLYGSAFIGMSKKAIETEDLPTLLEAGLEAIQYRGKAKANEKTMVDTWEPVIHALKTNNFSENFLNSIAESTKNMKATKGRASYLGERSINHIDPGATSSIYLFKTMKSAGLCHE